MDFPRKEAALVPTAKKHIRSRVRERTRYHIWVWVAFIRHVSADYRLLRGCLDRRLRDCNVWGDPATWCFWEMRNFFPGEEIKQGQRWTWKGQRVQRNYRVSRDCSSRRMPPLCVCVSVRVRSFSSQLRPRDLVHERTMIEQSRVISAPVPHGPQIALPAGHGRQITSHPYAECKHHCHPPSAASQWLLTEEEEEWRSIWRKRLMGYWSTPGWSKETHACARPIPNRDRCCDAASDYLMELVWAPGQEERSPRRTPIEVITAIHIRDENIKICELSLQWQTPKQLFCLMWPTIHSQY